MKWRKKGITRHRLNRIRNEARKNKIEEDCRLIYIKDTKDPKKSIDELDLRLLTGRSHNHEPPDPDPIRTFLENRFGKFKKFVDNLFYERMKMLYNFKMNEIAEAAFQQKYRECRKMKKKRNA